LFLKKTAIQLKTVSIKAACRVNSAAVKVRGI